MPLTSQKIIISSSVIHPMIREKFHREIIKKYARPLQPIPTALKPEGQLKKPVRAVLFDIYGTLFVSGSGDISIAEENISAEEEKTKELNILLNKYRLNRNGKEIISLYFSKIKGIHSELRKRGIDYPEVRIERVWKDILHFKDITTAREFSIEFEAAVNPVWPMPYLLEMIRSLIKRGARLGIISNAQFFTPLIFEVFFHRGPEELGFEKELSFYSFEYQCAKPSVILFRRAAEVLDEMGIAPSNVVYVGNDMLNDIMPSKHVGFQTALFAGDKRSLRLRREDPRCNGISPDLLFTHLTDLPEFI